jgi:uncharacterized protein (TIGR02118 family)
MGIAGGVPGPYPSRRNPCGHPIEGRVIVSNSLMRRRSDIDFATFCAHWLDPHGVLAARLPGCRHYVQNHVVDVPGTNARARALGIDGIPQLAFESPEDRLAAHNSQALRDCDRDSELFVGAVSRVLTEIPAPIDFRGPPGTVKQLLLFVPPQGDRVQRLRPDELPSRLRGLRKLVIHQVLEQMAAPGSKVPNLDIPVDGFCEAWLEDRDAVLRNTDVLDAPDAGVASFVVQVHPFI